MLIDLVRPVHIPQAFSIADGILWVGQLNTSTGNALITAYHQRNGGWQAGGQMAIYDCHGWPLIVDADRRVGVIAADRFVRFRWDADATVSWKRGTVLPRVQVPGGWSRVTANGKDRFYKGSTLLFTRDSPGWVQGELVRNNVLLTLRGSPAFTGNVQPDGIPNKITYTNASGQVIDTKDVPATIGSEGGQPIGGRKEMEGLWMHNGQLLVGTAVGRKPNYRYLITEIAL